MGDDDERRPAGRRLRAGSDARLLILEFGAGLNTPGVIRWPLENIVHHHEGARFVRVNPEYPEVPGKIAGRSLAWRDGAAEALAALTAW